MVVGTLAAGSKAEGLVDRRAAVLVFDARGDAFDTGTQLAKDGGGRATMIGSLQAQLYQKRWEQGSAGGQGMLVHHARGSVVI